MAVRRTSTLAAKLDDERPGGAAQHLGSMSSPIFNSVVLVCAE